MWGELHIKKSERCDRYFQQLSGGRKRLCTFICRNRRTGTRNKKLCSTKKGCRQSKISGSQKRCSKTDAGGRLLFVAFLYEGLPIVAVEAQAAGLPCFLSDQISEETKLSDLVEFLKLGDTRLWRNAILESRGKERKSRLQEIIGAGYDLNHQEKK